MFWWKLVNVFFLVQFGIGLRVKEHQAIIGTRCASRCLERHRDEFQQNPKANVSDIPAQLQMSRYEDCLTLPQLKCFQCINPCLRSFTDMTQCMTFCFDSLECMMSCVFLKEMSENKMGFCPATSTISYVAYQEHIGSGLVEYVRNSSSQSTCSDQCVSDFQCRTNLKCCRSVCQNVCRPPLNRKVWLPPRVNGSDIRIVESQNGRASLHWKSGSTSKLAPKHVMHVVEEQYYLSKGIPAKWKNWRVLSQTLDTKLHLHHLRRGYWYRFRVASVNLNGTRGFSVAREPFRLSARPRPPPVPSNIEQVSIRIVRGMKLNLQLRWRLHPGEANDLPIKGFHVRFSETSPSGHPIRHRTRHKYVKATQRSYTAGTTYWLTWIRNLRFFNNYNISIVTASGWKNYTLYSKRSYTSAIYPHNTPTENARNVSIKLPFVIRNNTVQANLTWQFTYSEAARATVKFMVVWTVDFCLGEYPISPFNQELVSGTSFLLKGLSRACRYLASTQAMYGSLRHQWSTPIEIIVDTPPCNLHIDRLVIISHDSCSQSSSFYIPSHTISTIEARVSTTAPVLASQLVWEDTGRNVTVLTVDGYFVTYTENQFNQLNWKMLEFNTKSSVTILPLRRNATYQVNIYRVTKKVAARASVVRFKTET